MTMRLPPRTWKRRALPWLAKLKVVLATTFRILLADIEGQRTASADVTMLAKSSALAKCCRAPLSGSGPSITRPEPACAAISGDC